MCLEAKHEDLKALKSLVLRRSIPWRVCDLEHTRLHYPQIISFFYSFFFPGSREAAFVYAISSAGVVYALTRACSQGDLRTCNCDPHKRGRARDERGEFDWGGCSDNINYGIKFAKAFIDAKERTVRDARALMNLHNNRCGRTVSWLKKPVVLLWQSWICHLCVTEILELNQVKTLWYVSLFNQMKNNFQTCQCRQWSASWSWSVNATVWAALAHCGHAGWPCQTSGRQVTSWGGNTTGPLRWPWIRMGQVSL